MMKKIRISGLLLMALAISLSACNLPTARPTQDPNAILTEAAGTIQAQLTADALLTAAAVTNTPPAPSSTPIPPTATQTPLPTITSTPVCDLGNFIQDVTISDGTIMEPGKTFTKTWRVKNVGSCTWNANYQLIFDTGEPMGGPASQPVTSGVVAPGQVLDISVNLTAPSKPGNYRGYWRIRNPSSVLMPMLNGHAGTSFFVDINVVAPTNTPTPSSTPSPTPTTTPE